MPDKNSDKKPVSENKYLKYSGMVFQLFVLLLIGGLIGRKLDNYFHNETAILTILLIMLFFGVYMYKLFKDLQNDEK
jgi:MFS-type transporter involved in bile tolerance (Atg22 family)